MPKFQQVLTVRALTVTNPTTGEVSPMPDKVHPEMTRVAIFGGNVSAFAAAAPAELASLAWFADKNGRQVANAVITSDSSPVAIMDSMSFSFSRIDALKINVTADLGVVKCEALVRGTDGKLHRTAPALPPGEINPLTA
jgi:hypothetical protein